MMDDEEAWLDPPIHFGMGAVQDLSDKKSRKRVHPKPIGFVHFNQPKPKPKSQKRKTRRKK